MDNVHNKQVQFEEHLGFGHPKDTPDSIMHYFHNGPPKAASKQRKQVDYKVAQQKQAQIKIDKVQKYRPQSAQEPPTNQNQKPTWNDAVQAKPGLFDKNLVKHEIFRVENKLQKQKEDQEKENQRKLLGDRMPSKQAVQSYQTINDIEEAILKQRDKKTEGQLKKHQKELDQLKWMIDQERRLKKETDKEFEQKLKQLKTRENPELAKDIQKIKKQKYNLDPKKQSPYKQQSKPKQPVEAIQEIEVDEPSFHGQVWKDALDVLHHEAKKPLLPGQYDDIDVYPQRQSHKGQGQRKNNSQSKYKEVPNTLDDNKLQQELIEIQKRELARQRELDGLIQRHQQLLKQESENPNKQYEAINNKLEKLRSKMDPVLKKFEKNTDTSSQFPFTGHLLARSVSKLVQLHNEKLTESIIDDILIETVHKLQEIESNQRQFQQKQRDDNAIYDYIEAVKDLALDQDVVEKRFQESRQQFMKRDVRLDQYTPVVQVGRDQVFYENPQEKIRSIETSSGFVIKVIEDRQKRSQFVSQQSLYAPKNKENFKIIADQLLDELLMERALQLESNTDQLAEQIFINEFK